MTPKKQSIALLLPSLEAGGIERSLLDLALGFRNAGYAVDLLPCRLQGYYANHIPAGVRLVELRASGTLASRLRLLRLDPNGFRVLARPALLPFKPAFTQRYLVDLVRYLRSTRPTTLLAANTPANLLALWARQQADVHTRVVISEHTHLSVQAKRSRRWRWRYVGPLVGRVYPQADAIVAVSEGVGDDLAGIAGLPRDAIRTIYNPVVHPDLAQHMRQASPHPWLADGAAPVIVAAGRLKPQKNFPLLLRAFARLRQRRPARLLIMGEGKQRRELESLTQRLGIGDAVAMPGYFPNPYAVFARAALFVLSSDWEGLPTVLIEALACGCPVVATDCPSGPAEILAGGQFGELVPPGDVDALALAMARTLDRPAPTETLRARGADFSLERSVARYLDLALPAAND